jgi:hypothetical protein
MQEWTFDEMPVERRTLLALRGVKARSWAHVAAMSPADFLRVPGCGATTVKAVREALGAHFGEVSVRWGAIPLPVRRRPPRDDRGAAVP